MMLVIASCTATLVWTPIADSSPERSVNCPMVIVPLRPAVDVVVAVCVTVFPPTVVVAVDFVDAVYAYVIPAPIMRPMISSAIAIPLTAAALLLFIFVVAETVSQTI